MSLNQETSISSKILLTENRWADFQKAFDADAVDPQNSQSDLGLFGQFNRLMKVTNKSFGLKLAIGGWTYSTYFSNAVRTASSRNSLANSIVTLFQQWHMFSGVTIDWEYITNDGQNFGSSGKTDPPTRPANVVHPSDAENFALFVETLRGMFNQQNWTNYTIAACFTAAPEKMKFDVRRYVPLLDEWHIMTYEYYPLLFLPFSRPRITRIFLPFLKRHFVHELI